MEFRDTVHDVAETADMLGVEDEPFLLRGVEPAEFSPLEEQVIALARTDGLATLETPGRIEKLFSFLFGLNLGRRALADPRLEALRRAVVVARHRHHLPDAQAAELREEGFSLPQVRMVELLAIGA
jgi:alkylhydroperoxidase family enzyme